MVELGLAPADGECARDGATRGRGKGGGDGVARAGRATRRADGGVALVSADRADGGVGAGEGRADGGFGGCRRARGRVRRG